MHILLKADHANDERTFTLQLPGTKEKMSEQIKI